MVEYIETALFLTEGRYRQPNHVFIVFSSLCLLSCVFSLCCFSFVDWNGSQEIGWDDYYFRDIFRVKGFPPARLDRKVVYGDGFILRIASI